MKSATLPTTLALLVFVALLTLAMVPPSPSVPSDISVGTQLFNLQLVRATGSVLPGAAVTSPVEVTEIRGSWIAVTYTGAQGKTNWVNFDHVVAYRTQR